MGASNMSNSDFSKNLFITYLDEVKTYTLGDYSLINIVSISMKKSYYINNIETKWKNLREKYSIPDGTCLHFTDIKALLNKENFYRPIEKRKLNIEKVFCNGNNLDKEKLYNFYTDIIDIINECEFDILVTGIRQEKSRGFKQHKKQLQNIWYVLFKQHLDNLAEYMTCKSDNAKNKKKKIYSTKLRFDGDEDLESRNDIRYAYADVMCNGTSRFNTEHCRDCFDGLKFVGKDEVGAVNGISHAGNELLDFIALYAAKYFSKDMMIDDYKKFKELKGEVVSDEEIKEYVDKNIKIYIDEKEIYPHKAIEKKIYKNKLF